MRIVLTKLSDDSHRVEIIRADDSRDSIELVTREALTHDFLHYAVETSMPTQRGFWGTLASGKTFDDLNDRSGAAVRENAEELMTVEGAVGVMTGVFDLPGDQGLAKLRWFSETQNRPPPDWCNARFVREVRECMRRLRGRWRATNFGQSMEIDWSEPDLC